MYQVKDKKKADDTNKFIGFGIENSSTYKYYFDALRDGKPVNIKEYNSSDSVFVSINGKTRINEENFNKTLDLVILALDNGATIVFDNRYNRNRDYNLPGEGRLYNSIIEKYSIENIDYKENFYYGMLKIIK